MKVLVSGGGTGGHIYPALSIVEEFSKDEKNEILYVGKKNSMESDIVPKAKINFKGIIVEGFNRKNKFKNILVAIKLIIALIQSFVIMINFNPDIVIGTGGYVSGPVLFTAALLRKKTYIHEQNSFPGMTNRILAKYVDMVVRLAVIPADGGVVRKNRYTALFLKFVGIHHPVGRCSAVPQGS